MGLLVKSILIAEARYTFAAVLVTLAEFLPVMVLRGTSCVAAVSLFLNFYNFTYAVIIA